MNDAVRRKVLRSAQQFHDAYRTQQQTPTAKPLPTDRWESCSRAYRRFELARQRGWSNAAEILHEDYLREIRMLTLCCNRLNEDQANQRQPMDQLPTLRLIYDEIVSLFNEFDRVELDLRCGEITVQTERIVLEDVDLGRFEILLSSQLLESEHPWRVIALDPNPAATSEDTTHPHVQGERLCAGDARASLLSALHQGRLCDLFLILAQTLNTYNDGSPFVRLEDWQGLLCADCGDLHPEDDLTYCEQCEDRICGDCSACCDGCNYIHCNTCLDRCRSCDDLSCRRCRANCADCGVVHCGDCLNESLCPDCLPEETDDVNDESETLPPDQTTLASSKTETISKANTTASCPAVQSHCLGEAAVPS